MPPTQPSPFAGGWKIVLICPSRALKSDLLPVLTQAAPQTSIFEFQAYPSPQVAVETLAGQGSNLCLIDVVTDPQLAVDLITQLSTLRPSLPVVALVPANEPDLILRCLRQGASEFLAAPFNSEQFEVVFERLERFHPRPALPVRDGGKVYCVIPAKGACGATTLASHLAHLLKKTRAQRVLLADLDPLTGTIAFLLKLKSNFSFVDALARAGTLDADLWKGLVTPVAGMDVLPSPENPVDGILEPRGVASIVEYARQLYDAVVVDTGGAYGDWNLTLAAMADELLLVTTNELPALQAAQRVLAYFDRNQVDRSKVRLVVNRYNREVGLGTELIRSALHTEIFHVLPSDYEAVQKALLEGKPLPPGSKLGKSIAALAERLAGGAPPEPQSSSPFSSLRSLFSRKG